MTNTMSLYDNPWFWLLAFVGVLLTGISKSGFAGGAGVVAVPLLAFIMPVNKAAALVLPLLLIMDAKTVQLYFKAINFQEIKTIALAALLGIAIAGFAMARLPEVALQLTLALFCIVFAAWQPLAPLLGKLPGAAMIWGTLSGISSTLLHAGGPPISMYFLAKGVSKQVWLAQAAIFFAMMNVVKLIPYTLNNAWQKQFIIIDSILLPVALLGVWLGYKIQAKLSEELFTRCCRLLLGITGALLFLKALN